MGRVPQVDPDQLAARRRLRAAFGPIEVLEVIDHQPGRNLHPTRGARRTAPLGPADRSGVPDSQRHGGDSLVWRPK
jgi:hypothetical protein